MGKTRHETPAIVLAGKHPHGRGEDGELKTESQFGPETPPRAWGRRNHELLCWPSPRNTPTGVGKTTSTQPQEKQNEKHPHGRGEDNKKSQVPNTGTETPPRAWGRRVPMPAIPVIWRNTPTGVGKTKNLRYLTACYEKHPHGRGEDQDALKKYWPYLETPPRAWGRRRGQVHDIGIIGNTPTGVGKTMGAWRQFTKHWKHPHGRGEDNFFMNPPIPRLETPPRAWGRRALASVPGTCQRNTPTGVGKTRSSAPSLSKKRKHPHGRGEDKSFKLNQFFD